jgi:lysophospholipase L1-like esterase
VAPVKGIRKVGLWTKFTVATACVALGVVLTELTARHTPLADKMDWVMGPPVPERVARAGDLKGGNTRILVLGDSMTAWRDNTGDSYVRVAERIVSGVDMVNLAEADTGLGSYLSNLQRYGGRLRPDLVLVGLYLGNNLFPAKPPLDRTSPGPSWKLLAKQSVLVSYLFRVSKNHIPSLRSDGFAALVGQFKARWGKDDAFVARKLGEVDPILVDAARADAINPWDLLLAIFDPDYYGNLAAAAPGTPKGAEMEGALKDLGTLIAAARAQDAKIAMVLLPPPVWVAERYRRYFKLLGNGELGPVVGSIRVVQRVKAYLAAEHVPTLDLLPALRADTAPSYLENDVRLNRHGHMVVGQELASFIMREELVKSRFLGSSDRPKRAAAH